MAKSSKGGDAKLKGLNDGPVPNIELLSPEDTGVESWAKSRTHGSLAAESTHANNTDDTDKGKLRETGGRNAKGLRP